MAERRGPSNHRVREGGLPEADFKKANAGVSETLTEARGGGRATLSANPTCGVPDQSPD